MLSKQGSGDKEKRQHKRIEGSHGAGIIHLKAPSGSLSCTFPYRRSGGGPIEGDSWNTKDIAPKTRLVVARTWVVEPGRGI